MKNSTGYTPFMIALSKKLDEDILRILNDSAIGAISDFNGLATAKNKVVDVYFEHDYKRIDSQKTLFRLEHKDPTLKCVALADSFHSLYPDKGDGSFDHYEHEKRVMDIFDAVKSFPHFWELILAVDEYKDILWREGNARNALFFCCKAFHPKSSLWFELRLQLMEVSIMWRRCWSIAITTTFEYLLRRVDTKCDEWDSKPG